FQAERGLVQDQQQAGKHDQGKDQDVQAVIGNGKDLVDLPQAAHEFRCLHRLVEAAENGAHQLLQHKADAESSEQGFQRPAIEEAYDTALNGNADGPGNNKGGGNGDDNRQGNVVGENVMLQYEGGVGTKHHHFAVRHIDHAHDTKGDGQADGGQHQHRAEAQAEKGGFESRVKRALAINA